MGTAVRTWLGMAALVLATDLVASDFGSKGGPEPANIDEVTSVLRRDPYDMELLISFGTSKGGSAGHLALALRDKAPGDDLVYSANFYADRSRKHAHGRYTADLMVAIPKNEYLFRTASSIDDRASFGLDFGEIYKRSVIGVRVYGVPAAEREALSAFFGRINDDYHLRVPRTEYHGSEIKYDYLNLNCAKTIGSAFRYGAGYRDLDVTHSRLSPRRRLASAANANVPTEMAMKLLEAWDSRGYGMDVVYYSKYGGSSYVDPHEKEKIAFMDLPNRFPSVLSRDFRQDQGKYKDFDNLFAMYVLNNLGKHRVRVNDETKLLEIATRKNPMAYPEAAERATRDARADSRRFLGRTAFRPSGTTLDGNADRASPHGLRGQFDPEPAASASLPDATGRPK